MTFKLPAAKDGTVVAARSMEFPAGLPTQLAVLPSDYAGTATVDGRHPREWTATYGVVGMGGFGHANWLVDGVNTQGVSAHLLYMPGGYCTYRTPGDDGRDLAQLDLVAYLLGTCANISDVRAAMAEVTVVGRDPGMGFVPPLHCLVHDSAGSVAIEFHPEETRVVDNPVSLATNAPFLDWHLINLTNYLGISSDSPAAERVGGLTLSPLGQGEGLLGVPGDFSPPARFVRLFNTLRLTDQATDGTAAELLALHLCNAFDIPAGVIKETVGTSLLSEVTDWDSVINLTTPRYAYRMIDNPETYVVDLASVDFAKPARLQDLRDKGAFTPIKI